MPRREFLTRVNAALCSAAFVPSIRSATRPPATFRFGDERDWFFKKRFGLFVHWGLYSIPGWHEQHQWRARVPRAEYVRLAGHWNPAKFNPEQWLDILQHAGMEYLCFTTKHHDGFCLWDSRQTRFTTMHTPYKRDILATLAEACHRRGVPLCLYYSIADWNHPHYPNQGRHHELPAPEPGDQPDWDRYMEFLKAQVLELCTHYGTIHGFWWDMNVPQHKDPAVNAMIRKLQPKAVINNRGFDDGDFGTPERDYDTAVGEAQALARPTEACQSVGMESWGYRKDENYYADFHLQSSIDRYLARGGNYLLNVGPTSQGIFPQEARLILRRIGKWYHAVKESLVDVTPASFLTENRNVLLTARDRALYVHLYKNPPGDAVKLNPIKITPTSAHLLNTGGKVDFCVNLAPSDHGKAAAYLRLERLPVNKPLAELA
jgi:alpha-L-fucosidase